MTHQLCRQYDLLAAVDLKAHVCGYTVQRDDAEHLFRTAAEKSNNV